MERIKLNIQKFADNNIEVELSMVVKDLQSAVAKANTSLNSLKNSVKDTKSETSSFKSVVNEIKNAFDKIDLSKIFNSIKRLGNNLYSNFLTKAIDTSEELNLFNVVFNNIEKEGKTVFSELGKEATQFQNKLNEAFGTNKKETMRYQGLFQAMGESAGIKEDIAALMSENMTKLAYDLASLYNTTETKAAESLRAGVYAGQTKPLRNYGIDVTQTSYKPLLEELGIEKSVSELTQAEKEILRYISTLNQAKNAMGDFANTINSPANQLKVLKQQFYEMQAAIGNLFVGAFSRILPYVNAIVMVIKEVAKAIASFFGIRMKDYNSNVVSYANDLDEYSDSLGGIGDSADSASNSIKALKRQTLGFDQINNLTSPTPSSGSGSYGGGGVSGGIDQRLLDAIKSYDNGMDKVRMKALDIRDAIMDWLGFTQKTNEETGETIWVLKDANSTMGLIIKSLGDIYNYGIKAIKNVFKVIKDDFDNGIFGKIIVTVFKSIASILKIIAENENAAKIVARIVEGILLFKTAKGVLDPIIKKFGTLGEVIAKVVGAKNTKKLTNLSGFTSKIKNSFNVPDAKTILKGIGDVALIIGGMAAIVTAIGLLTKIPGFNEAVTSGISSIVEIFTGIGKIFIPLAAVSAGMILLGSLGGAGVKSVALGLADLAIVIIGTETIVTLAGLMSKIPGDLITSGLDTITKIFNGIADIALPLAGMTIGLAAAGLLGGIGAAVLAVGLANLAIVILGTEGVIAAVGKISKIKGFNSLIDEGVKSLKKVFTGIGEIAGSLVKGFSSVAFDGLEEIGTHLSGFMENAKPFFEGITKVNEGVTNGIKNLAVAVLVLTANNILNGLTSWLTGGNSLINFGVQLAGFGPLFATFADSIKDIDPAVVEASANAAMTLADFADKIPNSGGIKDLFTGSNDLVGFAAQLPYFGTAMKLYGDSVKGLDTELVKNSIDAATTISEFASNLPNSGGIKDLFTGRNDLILFAAQLPAFGTAMKLYANNVKGIDTELVKNSIEAATTISEFAKGLPNTGGIKDLFTGSNDLILFALQLPSFGASMKKYSDNVKGIDTNVVNNSVKAAKSIAEMANILPNSGGIVSWFTGDNKLSDFGNDMKKFGAYFKEYYEKIKSIKTDAVNNITNALKSIIDMFIKVKNEKLSNTIKGFGEALSNAAGNIKTFFTTKLDYWSGNDIGYIFGEGFANGVSNALKWHSFPSLKLTGPDGSSQKFKITANANGGIFANGRWQPIQGYANGGIPSGGQLFMAREAGPELVGKIGRHTAVMNNNQIVDSVKAGVYEAVTAAMSNSGMGSVQIDLHTDEGVVVDRINRITRQTGTCPIDI